MKMQEVIEALRTEVPRAVGFLDVAETARLETSALWADYEACRSDEGRAALRGAFVDAMNRYSNAFTTASAHVRNLAKVNAGYTRKLGPKAPKKEDPRQMSLGLEGETA